MSINLPFVDDVRTAPQTILSRPLIKDLTRPCFHLLQAVVVLSLITIHHQQLNCQNYILFCHTSFVHEEHLCICCKFVSKNDSIIAEYISLNLSNHQCLHRVV